MMMAQQSIETGLITPPYTTDSSLELRSPDIIPPPIIGRHYMHSVAAPPDMTDVYSFHRVV